ncbi:MAG: hypothetical protein EPN73_02340 [Paraburkholderia sp.]|uniref:hypothetical protein n=1 Tax=Paraburkholderia sp. TaxID=1926495 RepID=UPI0012162FEE|nr:hypothetical protein [Paraburkholderia sp.]TAL98768.1 MAG: hypothetical protein EPN73_02340 [Paraburkholderia sp.]
MDSSTHFAYAAEQAGIRTIYVDNGREFDPKLVADVLFLQRPPARQRVSWEGASCSTTFAQPQAFATEEPRYQGLPPLGLPAACGDHEPEFVRFLDGADSAARETALQERMRQQCGKRGRMVLVLSRQGELGVRLDRVASRADAVYARSPERPFVVGIDGIDQRLESPSRRAFQVKALLNVGATVICAVDGRYSDSGLLAFHLRTLGIKVIRETLVTEGGANEFAFHKSPRASDATTSVAVGGFPEVRTPALTACGFKFQRHCVPTAKNRFARCEEPETRSELRRYWRRENSDHYKSTEFEREEYARAYRNPFAMNRLLCEGKNL